MMLIKLKQRYPESILTNVPPQKEDPLHLWLTTASRENFLAIPKASLTQSESDLLCSLFIEASPSKEWYNDSEESRCWHGFLYNGQPLHIPVSQKDDYRIIQFSIKEQVEADLLKEALRNIFAEQAVIVFTSPSSGAIVERRTQWSLPEEELFSAAVVIESDFYSTPKFFIGRFHSVDEGFLPLFKEERKLFSFAEKNITKGKIYTFPSTFPSFALHYVPKQTKERMFSDVLEIFSEDEELKKTIKTYLENQSNTSQTAKVLFMHRNSVQYRIDKFIEKVGIDIKTFQGAVTVYLACLEMEQDHMEG
ncbi:PucR family transcriptional regulator [Bacillus sp. AK031]